jgi:hypothetical protein
MGSLIGRAMIALGIGFTTYKGVDLAIVAIKQEVIDSMVGAPGQIFALAGYLWFDKGLTLIFSCCTAALSLKLTNGALKKLVIK